MMKVWNSISASLIVMGLVKGVVATEPRVAWVEERSERNRIVAESIDRHVKRMFEGMSPKAREGYRLLVEKPYLPADFDEDVFARLDQQRDTPPLLDIEMPRDPRQASWLRFGLTWRPEAPDQLLQYVSLRDGTYVMNCFACHGGNVYGAVFPGAPNTLYGLESLTEQVRRTKLSLKKPMTHLDVGSVFMPLGTTTGTSNAVMFGVALMQFRDADLNVLLERSAPTLTNHDMDAPPWWHFHRKRFLYIDGFAAKGHRGLMQFLLVKQNGPKQFQAWEEDFQNIYAYLEELRPPQFPLPVDRELAMTGRGLFQEHCASCHGTYGEGARYPERMVAIEEIGTDPIRFQSLTPQHRKAYEASWFTAFGKEANREQVIGYVAPPLDGVWASAPYFHNGSVPTLWQVLNASERPTLWRRTALGIDPVRIGIEHEEVESIPAKLNSYQRRWYFDTRQEGKSAAGHDYPDALSLDEKLAVLEYLKTL